MKTLTLVRHAKSSWNHPGLADFERPLNKRGQRDAPRMGSRLAAQHTHPQIIVSSPAVRALTTAEVIASALGCQPAEIITDERICHAYSNRLLEVIRADNPVDTVGMFTISQFLAVCMTLLGLIGLLVLRRMPPRSRRARLWEPPEEDPPEKTGKKKAVSAV